jgi:hypothetical protein
MNGLRTGWRPSPSLVLAAIALVFALGGTATATSLRQLEAVTEPYHVVGAPGEPAFGNGEQDDCIWANAKGMFVEGLNPAAFYRDLFGAVRLSGVVGFDAGPRGDGSCDTAEDAVAFVLPPGYRPENVEVVGSGDLEALVIPDEGVVIGDTAIKPGSVLGFAGSGATVLDGIEFRAAGPGTAPIEDSAPPVELGSIARLSRLLD